MFYQIFSIFGYNYPFHSLSLVIIDLLMAFFVVHAVLRRPLNYLFRKNQQKHDNKKMISVVLMISFIVLLALAPPSWSQVRRIMLFPMVKIFSQKDFATDVLVYVSALLVMFTGDLVASAINAFLSVHGIGFDFKLVVIGVALFFTLSQMVVTLNKKGHRLFSYINKNPVLKIATYYISFFITSVMYFFRSTYNWDYDMYYLIYLAFFGTLITTVSIRLVNWLQKRYSTLIMQNHDLRKTMRGIVNAANSGDVINVGKELADARYIMGIEEEVVIEKKGIKETLQSIVKSKIVRSDGEADIQLQVNSYEHNENVSLVAITVLLELLLDNAIETQTQLPILTKVSISEESVDIIVRNECTEKNYAEFLKYFKRGGTSKENYGHGIGLTKLKELVNRYNGKIVTKNYYCRDNQAFYLSVMVRLTSAK